MISVSRIKFYKVFLFKFIVFLIATNFSLFLEAKVINYNFDYLKLPVAKLSIDFNEKEYTKGDISFSLETQGLMKLHREYTTEGKLRHQIDGSWIYSINGFDRGQPEEKIIIYSKTKEPIIEKFIDDKGVFPLAIIPVVDIGSIDPFSIIINTISNLEKKKNCYGNFHVFDGKRRYKVAMRTVGSSLPDIDKNIDTGKISHCRLTVLNSENKSKNYRVWPFNKKNIFIDLWFSHEKKYLPIRIRVKTPIGSIVGKAVTEDF
tara:strand:- start:238 stop:1020 length:783 start_codon:yes stop_codon:yes gene_type:complete